jgi:hypothetical protein
VSSGEFRYGPGGVLEASAQMWGDLVGSAGFWWVRVGCWWVIVGFWWVLVGLGWFGLVLVGSGGSWWVLVGPYGCWWVPVGSGLVGYQEVILWIPLQKRTEQTIIELSKRYHLDNSPGPTRTLAEPKTMNKWGGGPGSKQKH